MELIERENFDVVLTDFRLPNEDGLKLIARARSLSKPPICILMTAYGSEELAVDAMKRGADDYIAKGRLQIDELEMRIARALKQQNLEVENVSLRKQLDSKFGLENIVGQSVAMKEIFDVVQQVAPTRATVLVTGESGIFLSPYYMDQWAAWYGGSTFAFPFSPAAVEQHRAHEMTLVPR